MRRTLWVLAALLVSVPLFAQDDGGGGGGAFAGGGGNQVFTRVDATNNMEQVKTFLSTKANVTLTSDQEKTLRPVVDAAFQQIRDLYANVTPPRGGQGGDRRAGRGRGGDQGAAPSLPPLTGAAAEQKQKINDDMMVKITAALKPDQQAALKKYLNDEIRKAGGFDALRLTMEEAGAPLTPDQEPQIRGFYNDDAQQRTQLLREAQGRPDPAKVAELEKATMGKVVKVLTAAQRKALLDSRTKAQ